MQGDIDQVLISRDTIADRVREIAGRITADLVGEVGPGDVGVAGPGPAGARPQITLVPILTGSFMFVADLIRHLPLYLQIRLTSVSSYPGTATTSRGAQIKEELDHLPASLAGQHALIIDDILDSGNTLRLVSDVVGRRGPASVRTCVLLRKKRPEAMAFPVDYVCFDIPDEFVVGYGLDYNDYYRNLPDIVTLKPEVIGLEARGKRGAAS
jgi:hypoxanthine phosphoribosyltransferase